MRRRAWLAALAVLLVAGASARERTFDPTTPERAGRPGRDVADTTPPTFRISVDRLPADDLGRCNGPAATPCGVDADCASGSCELPHYARRLPTSGGGTVVVAHLDSGVDCTHPDLEGRCWRNVAECDGREGVDDDGNGYVDDCEGWDFIDGDADPIERPGDCEGGTINGHGTATSSVYAAIAGNGAFIAGLAGKTDVRILNLRVVGCDNTGELDALSEAVRYAARVGADLANASLLVSPAWDGGEVDACSARLPPVGPCERLCDAIEDFGGLFVGASGQFEPRDLDAAPAYPPSCRASNQITVGGLDAAGNYITHRGEATVHVAAPATGIATLAAFSGDCRYCDPSGTRTDAVGSSFAAPQVTALAATLLSRDRTLPVDGLRAAVLAHAEEDAVGEPGARPVERGRRLIAFDRTSASLTIPTTGLTCVPPSDPAIVSFVESFEAIDDVDGPVQVDADVPALLLPGTTVLRFTATDAAGNAATAHGIVTAVPQPFPDGSPVPHWEYGR